MSQELILAIGALLAGICLLGGLVQALSDQPRRPRRVRRRGSGGALRRLPAEPVTVPTPGSVTAEAPSPADRPASPRPSPFRFTPRASPAGPEAPPAVAPPAAEEPPAVEEPEPAPAAAPPSATLAEAAPRVTPELSLDECLRLYDRQRYQEVVATAEPALERTLGEGAKATPPAQDLAKVWSVLALSRQALGDEEGARSAFEEAIHVAPDDDRPSYQRQMAALASSVGRRLLAEAEQVGESAGEDQVSRLRRAMLWLRQGLVEVPGDADLAAAFEQAESQLWDSYNRTVAALMQRQEFHRARRLIREALGDDEFPADRREHFKELLSATFTGEIGQLTASAIRTLEDEREHEALMFLQRAEGILSSVPADAMTPKRREDVNRRLWWGYTKLGMGRVEAEAYDDALEPLFHAFRIEGIDSERRQETRQALLRALEGVAEARGATITRLAKDGDRSGAGEEAERLKFLMRKSLEWGLTQQEMSAALAKTRRVMEWLEQGSGP